MYYMLYIDYILQKENLDVHTEKREPLLYDLSEVRFHRSTQLFVPFDNGLPYCLSYAIVIAIKTNKYLASYRGQPSRIQRDVVSSSIRCLKAVVCIYTYIYIYIYMQTLHQGLTVSQGLAHEL